MRRGQSAGTREPEMVTAREIASFAYCPEQWRLEHGLGLSAANQAELDAGRRHHTAKAIAERLAGGAIAIGRILVILAILALVIWVATR